MTSIIDDVADPKDTTKFQKAYEDQCSRGQPSTKAQFEYAYCLIRSSNSNSIRSGIALFEDLLRRDDEGEPKRDYIFYIAIGETRAKNYEKALKYVDTLLSLEPGNGQFIDLHAEIKRRMKKDGLIGAAILGGAALVGGAVLAGIIGIAAASKK